MTDIVTGTVVHFKANANPTLPPEFDPSLTKIGVTVNVPDGTDDCTAEVAIFARYYSDIPDATGPGNPPPDRDRKQVLGDATKGFVQVIDLRRTKIPSIK